MTEDTLLLRQVNPVWIQQGHVTSQVFRPTPKDQKLLSAYDGDRIPPEKAWRHFTEKLGYASVGVMAVSSGECAIQNLHVRPDPSPFPEHIVIDFTGFSEGQIQNKAKYLKRAAVSRGWLYQAEDL